MYCRTCAAVDSLNALKATVIVLIIRRKVHTNAQAQGVYRKKRSDLLRARGSTVYFQHACVCVRRYVVSSDTWGSTSRPVKSAPLGCQGRPINDGSSVWRSHGFRLGPGSYRIVTTVKITSGTSRVRRSRRKPGLSVCPCGFVAARVQRRNGHGTRHRASTSRLTPFA